MNLNELMRKLSEEHLYSELLIVNDKRSPGAYYGRYEVMLNRNSDGVFTLFWCDDRGMVCGAIQNVSEQEACDRAYFVIKHRTEDIIEMNRSMRQ